jgi:hypothetical protein
MAVKDVSAAPMRVVKAAAVSREQILLKACAH